jgi:CheY-like chemotaxis protein
MRAQLAPSPPPPPSAPAAAVRRVLIVDDDPAIQHLIAEILLASPFPFQTLSAESAEAALRILAADGGVDVLLADVLLPGMDGLQLVVSARALRPGLKVVVMTSEPSADLYRAALESGAARLLSKPLDFDDLLATVEADRPGGLSRLEGDLDLVDVCRLSAACQGNGGLRLRQGESEGVLVHRGATLVHAAVDGQIGEPAFETLRDWRRWQFESLPAPVAAALPPSLEMPLTDARRLKGARAGGVLRGLTLRHLIEWAMRTRQSCTLMVVSGRRTGILAFEGGSIRGAETADRDGGSAAAEILTWENLRVELIRSPATASAEAAPLPPREDADGLDLLIDRFREEVEGFIATSVVRRRDASAVIARSADPRLDAAAAAVRYAQVVDSHLAAVRELGAGAAWGETEDLLITTGNVYLLIRLLGDHHYHWLAVSSQANLALCRLLMRSHEAFLLSGLADLGEMGDWAAA